MAFSLIDKVVQATITSDTVTAITFNSTAADLILVAAAWTDAFGGTQGAPVDSGVAGANTWVQVGSDFTAGNFRARVLGTIPANVGASHVVTLTHSVFGNTALEVVSLSGAKNSVPTNIDGTLTSALSGDSFHAGDGVTPVGTDYFVGFAFAKIISGTGISVTLLTEQVQVLGGNAVFSDGTVSILESGSSQDPVWTCAPTSSTFQACGMLVAVEAAAGGGGRASKNIRSNPLGMALGMGIRMPGA